MDILALSLERGEIDVFYNYAASYPYHYLEKLARKDEFRFEEKLNQGLVFLGFNLKKTPLGDPAFREALSFAVDYEEIIRVDALGYGRVPNRGFVPESMGGFITTEGLRHDPERAKALLETAGYRDTDGNGIREADGRELRLVLLIRPEFGRVAELLRDYLKNVGLAAEIKTVDASAWFKEKDEYRYDLTITRTTPWGMLMHAGLGTGYFDSRRTGQGVLHNLEDPAFLGIADAALSTTRGDKLAALAGDIQRYYAEKLPGIALYWNKIVTPYRKTVRGLKPNPLFGIYSIEGLIGVEKE
jgi:peptide/nickel transport system substrate-binding protein